MSYQNKVRLIGLMSGTSVDGVDAALVEFDSVNRFNVVETEFTPFSDKLRQQITETALDNSRLFRNEDSDLHTILADCYANACLSLIKKSAFEKKDITAIANHGQTVRHEPTANPPFSLQLGDGHLIAELTGIPTITQFRQADLSLGGQGAPLMPAFHKALFGDLKNSFVLNIGGIANITRLQSEVVGFDTGPGNTLLDQWVMKNRHKRFDQHGRWGRSGQVLNDVLSLLMTDPYLYKSHPKSTGTDYYNLDWLTSNIPDLGDYLPEDIQATLLAFTVESIALAFSQLNTNEGRIYVCGGGARNEHLMETLQQRLAGFQIDTTDSLGLPCDWVEAVGFAWLGYCYLNRIPSNLPEVTGARKFTVLGEMFEV